MKHYGFHAAAAYFPLHTPEEFAELRHSLEKHGYDATHPIVLCEEQILDGRNRYAACSELGLEATFVVYVGNPFEKAWLENGSRRDLQAGQKAAIRLQIALASDEWRAADEQRQQEANEKRRDAATAQAQSRSTTGTFSKHEPGRVQSCTRPGDQEKREESQQRTPSHLPQISHAKTTLANNAGVSPRTAAQAITLAKKAPALLDKVARGEISLQDATKESNRARILEKAGDAWTPFEQERRKWVEELGYPTLANYHCDPHLIAWAKETGRHVFIGRGSLWGNPFEVGKDGTRDYVLASYERYYFPRKPSLQKLLHDLDGKVLECYCVPQRCHGETLIKMLNSSAWDILNAFLQTVRTNEA